MRKQWTELSVQQDEIDKHLEVLSFFQAFPLFRIPSPTCVNTYTHQTNAKRDNNKILIFDHLNWFRLHQSAGARTLSVTLFMSDKQQQKTKQFFLFLLFVKFYLALFVIWASWIHLLRATFGQFIQLNL